MKDCAAFVDQARKMLKRIIYNSQYDILSIDSNIKKKFENEQQDLDKFKQLVSDIESILKTLPNDSELLEIKNEILTRIDDIENQESFSYYLLKSFDIINEYKNNVKKPIKIEFFSKKKKSPQNNDMIQQCIQNYFDLIEKYFNVAQINMTKNKSNICKHCKAKKFEIVDEYKKICTQCGAEINTINANTTYKDSSRINITPKYTYAEIVHFRDCINQYQAKQNKKIPQIVYDDLELQFKLNRLLVDSPDKKIKYSRILKKHIHMFLKDCGHSSYYKDSNFIFYKITGKTPPNISHLEDKLYEDFKSLLQIYYDIPDKDKDRNIFLNYQFIFYQLLRKYKVHVEEDDFSLLKTIECIDDHNELGQRMFEQKGWEFHPYT